MLNVICAEYRNLFIDMLNVVILSVIRLNVFMVSVVAPGAHPYKMLCSCKPRQSLLANIRLDLRTNTLAFFSCVSDEE
jgi:hypothetical protein